MSRSVIWSRRARKDLNEQAGFIAGDNPGVARRIVARISETAASLGRIPIGRPSRVHGAYEKSVSGLPYIICYQLSDNPSAVAILRVIHTARDWPADEWPE